MWRRFSRLRSLYFALAALLDRFRYLHYGLGAILAFAALKMLAAPWIAVPVDALAGGDRRDSGGVRGGVESGVGERGQGQETVLIGSLCFPACTAFSSVSRPRNLEMVDALTQDPDHALPLFEADLPSRPKAECFWKFVSSRWG